MAKKKQAQPKPGATFEVRFVATDLLPEKIPLRAVNKVLSAIQDIACGRDPFEDKPVPEDKTIRLINVRRGSAVYCCISHAPEEAVENLARAGTLLTSLANGNGQQEELVTTLQPIRYLSDAAESVGCSLQVRVADRQAKPLLTVDKDAYRRISDHLFVKGITTIVGTVERAGGATGERCLLRIAGRRRGLYCDVKGRKLVRRLGKHLYEQIAATGTATWIHRTWRIHEFVITDFTQPKMESVPGAIDELRAAGLSAWDDIDDPEKYIRELRQ